MALAEKLALFGIERVVSSPYLRAMQSIAPFAARHGLTIETDARLRERVLSTVPLDDWQVTLRRTFEDADFAAPGGETSREAEARAAAVFEAILTDGRTTAVVSHGNLTSLLLRRLGWPMDFAVSLRLSNPDVFCIRPDGCLFAVTRLWR